MSLTQVTTGLIQDSAVTSSKLAADVITLMNSITPTGTILPFAGTSAPINFVLCDGSSYPTTGAYANLYSVIGYRYGGSGANFNVPDLRYNFMRGAGPERNVTGSGTVSSNNATFTNHGFVTGDQIKFTSGTLSGLTLGVDYYVIFIDSNTIAFASTYANALANSKIAISGSNSAVITDYQVWAVGSGTVSSNNATFTNHGVNRTGFRLQLAAGTLSGLSTGVNYYAIVVDSNTLAFATTYANAMSGTKISISGTNTGAIQQSGDPDVGTRGRVVSGSALTGVGTRQEDQFGSHTHSITGLTGSLLPVTYASAFGQPGTYEGLQGGGPQQHSYGNGVLVNSNSGGNQTNPINVYVNYMIKL